MLHGDAKYYDVLERTLYNGLISGISLDGNRFFYPNPLESKGQHERSEWFGCACCPSNICRFMPSIPGYMYARKGKDIYLNLFVESEAKISMDGNDVSFHVKTDYPWDGKITITVNPSVAENFRILVRIPGWARNKPVPSDLYSYVNPKKTQVKIKINGRDAKFSVNENGYAVLSKKWQKNDKMEIDLPMPIQRVVANEKVADDVGKIALERGPLVYCLEWMDNVGSVLNSVLDDGAIIKETFLPEKLGGIVEIKAKAKNAYRNSKNDIALEPKTLTAIPYYAWANRGSGEMAVWIPRSADAIHNLPPTTICTKAKVSSSISNNSISAVNDGFWPQNSNDRSVSFFNIWSKKNSTEWIEYEFEKPERISKASIFWFDDEPWGECRIPLEWKVQYKDAGGGWHDVKAKGEYKIEKDRRNSIEFENVNAKGVRVLFKLAEKYSAGVYEFLAE